MKLYIIKIEESDHIWISRDYKASIEKAFQIFVNKDNAIAECNKMNETERNLYGAIQEMYEVMEIETLD
jgi:hypothetical protein